MKKYPPRLVPKGRRQCRTAAAERWHCRGHCQAKHFICCAFDINICPADIWMASASLWLHISAARHAKEQSRTTRCRRRLVPVIERWQFLKYALQNLCYACHSRRPFLWSCQCQNSNSEPKEKQKQKQKLKLRDSGAESVQWLSLGLLAVSCAWGLAVGWLESTLLWRPATRLCLNLDGHVGDSFWLASASTCCKWRGVQSIRLEIMLNISFQICDWSLPDVAKTQMQATNNYEIQKLISIFIKLIHTSWKSKSLCGERVMESAETLRRMWDEYEKSFRTSSIQQKNARNSSKI